MFKKIREWLGSGATPKARPRSAPRAPGRSEAESKALAVSLYKQWQQLWNAAKPAEALVVMKQCRDVARDLPNPGLYLQSLLLLATHPLNDDERTHAERLQEVIDLSERCGATEIAADARNSLRMFKSMGG